MDFNQRLSDIKRFYGFLDELEARVGGKRILANCNGRMNWPKRGVYFFFEPGELRTTSGDGSRVVRVGTHALKTGSQTALWNRLSQHQGVQSKGGGNHRGSVFRLHVGKALIGRDGLKGSGADTWGVGSSAPKHVRHHEQPIEKAVSQHIRNMPFLWLEVNDTPGINSLRGFIECNAIALLSNYYYPDNPIDPTSKEWLGRYSNNYFICHSGLWNVNHVQDAYSQDFLRRFDQVLETICSKY